MERSNHKETKDQSISVLQLSIKKNPYTDTYMIHFRELLDQQMFVETEIWWTVPGTLKCLTA